MTAVYKEDAMHVKVQLRGNSSRRVSRARPHEYLLEINKQKAGLCPVESIELPGTRSMREKSDDTLVSRLLKRKTKK
jgi:hypothetical protein